MALFYIGKCYILDNIPCVKRRNILLTMLSRNWWLLALRGVIAILFGILTFLYPTIALGTFVLVFGVYAVIDGLAAIWSAIQHRTQQGWWILLLEGFVSIIAGIISFV